MWESLQRIGTKGEKEMGLPNRKELDRVRKKLENIEPVRILSADAPKADRFKYDLCKKFVVYLRENNLSQLELAKEIGIDPARMNEIDHYKIELFTADRLIEYLERLQPKLKLTVA